MKNKNGKLDLNMVIAGLSLLAALVFLVYGLVFTYFDLAVLACYLFSGACFAAYARCRGALFSVINVLGVFLMSFGLGLFFLNSYTVWADWYGHFDMYGSRGGVVPVIAQMFIAIVTIVLGIVSCFKNKEA